MATQIDIKKIAKAIAAIEKAINSPLVRPALLKLLPDFGLTPEQITLIDSHHADYVRWAEEAKRRSSNP